MLCQIVLNCISKDGHNAISLPMCSFWQCDIAMFLIKKQSLFFWIYWTNIKRQRWLKVTSEAKPYEICNWGHFFLDPISCALQSPDSHMDSPIWGKTKVWLTAPAELPRGSESQISTLWMRLFWSSLLFQCSSRYNGKQNFVVTHKIMKNSGIFF